MSRISLRAARRARRSAFQSNDPVAPRFASLVDANALVVARATTSTGMARAHEDAARRRPSARIARISTPRTADGAALGAKTFRGSLK
jgi:hypothetical protein|tara:strand:+ start:1654 stop:1917 length:264 start_codon:yes stop_codon:yes gene_type:complete